jgi:hypothetical protein
MTGSGPFTSATSCSDASTDERDYVIRASSSELSPMLPVYSVTYVPGCSRPRGPRSSAISRTHDRAMHTSVATLARST